MVRSYWSQMGIEPGSSRTRAVNSARGPERQLFSRGLWLSEAQKSFEQFCLFFKCLLLESFNGLRHDLTVEAEDSGSKDLWFESRES